jgi:hypothetical protein
MILRKSVVPCEKTDERMDRQTDTANPKVAFVSFQTCLKINASITSVNLPSSYFQATENNTCNNQVKLEYFTGKRLYKLN